MFTITPATLTLPTLDDRFLERRARFSRDAGARRLARAARRQARNPSVTTDTRTPDAGTSDVRLDDRVVRLPVAPGPAARTAGDPQRAQRAAEVPADRVA